MSNSKLSSYYLGLFAELVVIIYLFFSFYKILAWRYKTKFGEIDIIAQKAKTLIFVEVKARKNHKINEVLSSSQQKRIKDAAELFIQRNSKYSGYNIRFDLIIFNSAISLNHTKNSW